jgi:integrase
LALFSTAIDTMLRAQDLLPLVVGDVQSRNGSIRPLIEVARARGMPPVRCALSKATANALEKWITSSGRKRTDYVTGQVRLHCFPQTTVQNFLDNGI